MSALEQLEWKPGSVDELAHRLASTVASDIRMGAQLLVQPAQCAVFVRDGKCLDRFAPGRHRLSSLSLPLLRQATPLPFGDEGSFRAVVYFVNEAVSSGLVWRTRRPIHFQDRELGLVRLHGRGTFAVRVGDPALFLNSSVGSRDALHLTDVEAFLHDLIVARLEDFLGERLQSSSALAASYPELSAALKARLRSDYRRYGLELTDFSVGALTAQPAEARSTENAAGLRGA